MSDPTLGTLTVVKTGTMIDTFETNKMIKPN